MLTQEGANVKCSICCPKCKKFTVLSSYFTLAGLGFRMNNYSRHVATFHSEPLNDVIHSGMLITRKVKPIYRPALKRLNQKRIIPKPLNSSLDTSSSSSPSNVYAQCVAQASQIPLSTSAPDSAFHQKLVELYTAHKQLKNENAQLRENMLSIQREVENEMMNQMAGQLQRVSVNQSTDADVKEWKEKAEKFEMDLIQAQTELRATQIERRNLLHSLLDLKGKVRVMARLRPLVRSSDQILFEISRCKTRLKSRKFIIFFLVFLFYGKFHRYLIFQ